MPQLYRIEELLHFNNENNSSITVYFLVKYYNLAY